MALYTCAVLLNALHSTTLYSVVCRVVSSDSAVGTDSCTYLILSTCKLTHLVCLICVQPCHNMCELSLPTGMYNRPVIS